MTDGSLRNDFLLLSKGKVSYAYDSCLLKGRITRINYDDAAAAKSAEVTANVAVYDSKATVLLNVSIRYYCEGYHNGVHTTGKEAQRVGFEAFKVDDEVILFKERGTAPLTSEEVKIVGHADGLPHPCFKCKAFEVANSYIDLTTDRLESGPLPDVRVVETTKDNPAVVSSPAYIAYGMYTDEFIQLFVIGGVPPFRWYVKNIDPEGSDTEQTFQIQGTETKKRDAFLKPDEKVLGLAEVTVIDSNGHGVQCYVRTPGCFRNSKTGKLENVPKITTSSSPMNCGESRLLSLSPDYPLVTWIILSGSGSLWPGADGKMMLLSPSCSSDSSEWQTPIVVQAWCRHGRTGAFLIDQISIPIANPCGPANIVATTTQMQCSATQTLTTSDGNAYYWRIKSDDGTKGTLSTSYGASTVLTAPATNASCLHNATIELGCNFGASNEVVIDTVNITYNKVTTGFAFETCECSWDVPTATVCGCGVGLTEYRNKKVLRMFDCQGNPYAYVNWGGATYYNAYCRVCAASAPDCLSYPFLSEYCACTYPSTIMKCSEMTISNPRDLRSTTQITNGCCPESLMTW